MAAITTASPKILSLPQVGSTGILGAGIGFNSQVSTGTIPSTNTDTTAILGIADLQLSAFGSANAGGANGVGSRWTPKHLTITVTNTSGETLTGLTLTTSNVDAPAAPGSADYAYGTASEWPSGGLASGDSVTVTYTILGTLKRYLWLTGTWTTAPTSGSVAVDANLSGEGSATAVLSGQLPVLDSSTSPLDASGTYTTASPFLLTGYKTVVGSAYSDQSGSLLVEQSQDGTNWDVQSTITITGGSPSAGFDVDVVSIYGRLNYTNGATAQTTFRLYARGKAL